MRNALAMGCREGFELDCGKASSEDLMTNSDIVRVAVIGSAEADEWSSIDPKIRWAIMRGSMHPMVMPHWDDLTEEQQAKFAEGPPTAPKATDDAEP